MEKYQYPGFDMMEPDDPRHHAVPLCDVLRAVADRKMNVCYIADSMFPLEFTELILHCLEHGKGVPRDVLEDFRKRYITMSYSRRESNT